MEPRSTVHSPHDPVLDALAGAWADVPPAPPPDLVALMRVHLEVDAVNDPLRLATVVRADALERRRRGLPWTIDHFRAAFPQECAPGATLTQLLLGLELGLDHRDCEPGARAAAVRARLGEAYTVDIERAVTGGAAAAASLRAAEDPIDPDATADWAPIGPDGGSPFDSGARDAPQRRGDHRKGDRIGAYILRTRLGAGGFGAVWLAERRAPDMTVAIKLLHAERRGDLARFDAEAQALARLSHECIARILDFQTAPDGDPSRADPYLVMEYIEGEPITTYCDRRRLSVAQRLELVARVADAIHHAHSRQIVHRDLKPANILVTEYRCDPSTLDERERHLVVGREGNQAIVARPKIVDFGLAKSLDPNVRLTGATLTSDFGKWMGTFEYMAPEQINHDPLGVDTRADIFALGVVLYELVTGVRPLSSDDLRRDAIDQAIAKVRNVPRPEPSTRFATLDRASAVATAERRGESTPERLARQLRGRLRHLASTALRLEKERRFSSAAAMARDIRHYLVDEAYEEAAAEPFSRTLWLAVRRRPMPYAAAAIVLLTVMTALFTVTALWRDAEAARRDAHSATREAERQRTIAEQQTTKAEEQAAQERAQRDRADRASYHANLLAADQLIQGGRPSEARKRLHDAPHHLRHWEWGHLMAVSDGATAVLRGHTGPVRSGRYSFDGNQVLTHSDDGTVRQWTSDGLNSEVVFRAPEGESFLASAFGPAGPRVVTRAADGSAIVRDVRIPGSSHSITGWGGAVGRPAFSPDGTKLVVPLGNGTAQVWSVDGSGSPIVLQGNRDPLLGAQFSPDGDRIVTWTSQEARLWNADGSGAYHVLGTADRIGGTAFGLGADQFLLWHGKTLEVWKDLDTGRSARLSVGTRELDVVLGSAFASNDSTIMALCRSWHSGPSQSTVLEWRSDNVSAPAVVRAMSPAMVGAFAVSTDGHRLLLWPRIGALELHTRGADGRQITLSEDEGCVVAAFAPDGDRIVALTQSSSGLAIRIWTSGDFTAGRSIALHALRAEAYHLDFAPDGSCMLAVATGDGIEVWREAHNRVDRLTSSHMSPQFVNFCSTGMRIATASSDGTVQIHSFDDPSPPVSLWVHPWWVERAEIADDGQTLLTITSDRVARVWRLAADGAPSLVEDHRDQPLSTLSRSGRRVALAAEGRTSIALRDLTDQTQVELDAPQRLTAVSLSRTGNVLVAISSTGAAAVRQQSGDVNASMWTVVHSERGNITMAWPDDVGDWLVTADDSNRATLWALASLRAPFARGDSTAQSVITLKSNQGYPVVGHDVRPVDLSFTLDGLHFITSAADSTARVWDSRRPHAVQLAGYSHYPHMYPLHLLPSQHRLIRDNEEYDALLVAAAGGLPAPFCPGGSTTDGVASPDLQLIASRHDSGIVRVWRAASPEVPVATARLEAGEELVGVAEGLDSYVLVTRTAERAVRLAHLGTARSPELLHDSIASESPSYLWVSPKQNWLFGGGHDESAHLWHRSSEVARLQTSLAEPHIAAIFPQISSDDEFAIVRDGASFVYVDRNGVHPLTSGKPWPHHSAVSPDSTLIATTVEAGDLVLWSASAGAPPIALERRSGAYIAFAFADDSVSLLAQQRDGSVERWSRDDSEWTLVRTSRAPLTPTGIRRVAPSPDLQRWAESDDGRAYRVVAHDDALSIDLTAWCLGIHGDAIDDAYGLANRRGVVIFTEDGATLVVDVAYGHCVAFDSVPVAYRNRMERIQQGQLTHADLERAVDQGRLEPWEIEPLPWVLSPTLPGRRTPELDSLVAPEAVMP